MLSFLFEIHDLCISSLHLYAVLICTQLWKPVEWIWLLILVLGSTFEIYFQLAYCPFLFCDLPVRIGTDWFFGFPPSYAENKSLDFLSTVMLTYLLTAVQLKLYSAHWSHALGHKYLFTLDASLFCLRFTIYANLICTSMLCQFFWWTKAVLICTQLWKPAYPYKLLMINNVAVNSAANAAILFSSCPN
jgi:hypothetical protein